jgi:hypothetical protein
VLSAGIVPATQVEVGGSHSKAGPGQKQQMLSEK